MADNVEVKIVGDGGPARTDADATARSIDASLKAMAESLKNWGTQNRQITEQAIKNNADLSRTFLELRGSMTGGFNAIVGVVERFRGVIGSLAAVLAGGLLWKESVAEMLRMEDAVRGLTITFGLDTDAATRMAIQIKLAGIEAGTFEAMAFKVGRTLKANADEFDRLKVAVKDANGNFLPMDQILQNIFKRMQDFKAGTDQNEFALTTVGRSATEFASDMLRLNAVTERAAQLQHELGIEMGPDRIAAIEAYRIETAAFGVVMGSVGDRIGEAVMPRLMALAQYFNDVGPSAANVFIKALTYVLSGLDVVATHAREIYILVASNWDNLVIKTAAMGQAIKALFTEGWNAAVAIAEDANRRILRNQMETNAQILGMEADMVKRLGALQGERATPAAGMGPMPGGAERFTPKPTGGTAEDVVAKWRNELEQIRDAQGLFNEMSKRDEAAFWEAKLALVQKGSKDYIAVYHLMHEALRADARDQLSDAMAQFQLQIDAAKENKDQQISIAQARTATLKAIFGEESKEYAKGLDEELKIRQAWVKRENDIMLARGKMALAWSQFEYDSERLALDQAVALRRLSADQQFAIEQDLENKLYASKLAELERERAVEGLTIEQKLAVDAKIEALEQQHQLALTKIANAAALERAQFAIQASQAVEDSFGTFLSDVEGRTKSLSRAFKDMANSIISDLNRIAAQQIAKALFGGGTAGGGFLMSLFGGGSSAGGGGGGWVSGFDLPGFAMGTPYVPQDMIVKVHQGEAIIPAAQNVKGFGAGVNVVNQFSLSGAVDVRTQQQIAAAAAAGTQHAIRRNL